MTLYEILTYKTTIHIFTVLKPQSENKDKEATIIHILTKKK